MITKLKTLQTILGVEGFVLTGSLALMYHGLIDESRVNDIDLILVNPSENARAVLDNLQAAEPSPKFRPGGPVNYSFFYEGVKIDIWVQDRYEEERVVMTEEGIRLANVKHIVQAKKSINRPKDWVNLMQIAKRIYDPVEFEKVLPSITEFEGYTPVPKKQATPAEKPERCKMTTPSLEDIKGVVVKLTKGGKTADVKRVLQEYDAMRVSDLDDSEYSAFYNSVSLIQ